MRSPWHERIRWCLRARVLCCHWRRRRPPYATNQATRVSVNHREAVGCIEGGAGKGRPGAPLGGHPETDYAPWRQELHVNERQARVLDLGVPLDKALAGELRATQALPELVRWP
jgi:hypothetical protein